jgi:hypothetical protein
MKATPAELGLVPDRVRRNGKCSLAASRAGICATSGSLAVLDDQVAEFPDGSMTACTCQHQPRCLPNRWMSIGNRNWPADETHWA